MNKTNLKRISLIIRNSEKNEANIFNMFIRSFNEFISKTKYVENEEDLILLYEIICWLLRINKPLNIDKSTSAFKVALTIAERINHKAGECVEINATNLNRLEETDILYFYLKNSQININSLNFIKKKKYCDLFCCIQAEILFITDKIKNSFSNKSLILMNEIIRIKKGFKPQNLLDSVKNCNDHKIVSNYLKIIENLKFEREKMKQNDKFDINKSKKVLNDKNTSKSVYITEIKNILNYYSLRVTENALNSKLEKIKLNIFDKEFYKEDFAKIDIYFDHNLDKTKIPLLNIIFDIKIFNIAFENIKNPVLNFEKRFFDNLKNHKNIKKSNAGKLDSLTALDTILLTLNCENLNERDDKKRISLFIKYFCEITNLYQKGLFLISCKYLRHLLKVKAIPVEVLLFTYHFISFCHFFIGEYFEAIYYVTQGILKSHSSGLYITYRYFTSLFFYFENYNAISNPNFNNEAFEFYVTEKLKKEKIFFSSSSLKNQSNTIEYSDLSYSDIYKDTNLELYDKKYDDVLKQNKDVISSVSPINNEKIHENLEKEIDAIIKTSFNHPTEKKSSLYRRSENSIVNSNDEYIFNSGEDEAVENFESVYNPQIPSLSCPNTNYRYSLNCKLADIKNITREIRLFNMKTKYPYPIDKLKVCYENFHDFSFISIFILNSKMCINIYDSNITIIFEKIDMVEKIDKLRDIIFRQKETFKMIIETEKDKRMWWKIRIELDNEIKKIINEMDIFIETIICLNINRSDLSSKNNIHEISNEERSLKNANFFGESLENKENSFKNNATLNKNQDIERNTKNTNTIENIIKLKKNIFLITDENTTEFPFELLKIFSNKSVYRVPSLEYLIEKSGNLDRRVKVNNISYILDPENNLINTRKRIHKFLSDICLEKIAEVNHLIGQVPSKPKWKEMCNSDIFMYFGHGTGEKYWKNDLNISKNENTDISPKNQINSDQNSNEYKSKISFIFGCSSSKLLTVKNFKRNGVALKYLETNRNYLGCLWDTTDKDLDIFAIEFLSKVFENTTEKEKILMNEKFKETQKQKKFDIVPQHNSINVLHPLKSESISFSDYNTSNEKDIGSYINYARQKMKLKYLNGGAVVIWGLPTILKF